MKRNLEIILGGTSGITSFPDPNNAAVESVFQPSYINVSAGSLDLFEGETYSLNYSVSDIRDISARKSAFSKTIMLPGTANNNRLLGHLFEIGNNGSFNPNRKVSVQVLSDTAPVFEGSFQLTGVQLRDRDDASYEAVVFAENDDFISSLGELQLTDINFSALSHSLTYGSIVNSWTAATSPGYYYPLIDYGYDWSLSDVQGANNNGLGVHIEQMRPAMNVKTILDGIFSDAKYTYSSAFFNSALFKRLIIPYGRQSLIHSQDFITSRNFKAFLDNDYSFIKTSPSALLQFFTIPSGPGNAPFDQTAFNPSGLYSIVAYEFTADQPMYAHFGVVTQFDRVNASQDISVLFYKNNVPWSTTIITGSQSALSGSLPAYSPPMQLLNTGDKVSVKYLIRTTGPTGAPPKVNIYSAGTFFYSWIEPIVAKGSTYDFNQAVPQKIKQSEFFTSLVKMFNLYVEPSKTNPKQLVIEPRDVYYAGGKSLDWSSKLDINEKATEKILGELQSRSIILSYKKDKDFFNADYTNRTLAIYGEKKFDVDNDFVKGEKRIEPFFSPTPLANIDGGPFFVMPRIMQLNNQNQAAYLDTNLRVLQTHPSGVVVNEVFEQWRLDGILQASYPYAGHLNHPFSGNSDINFGETIGAYYPATGITNQNLFVNYWQNTLLELSDADSRLVTCRMALTAADIAQLSFRDRIFIDGIGSHGHYFRINKISDYDPSQDGMCTVELIKIREGIPVKPPNTVTPFTGVSSGEYVGGGVGAGGGSIDDVAPPGKPWSGKTSVSSGNLSTGKNIINTGAKGNIAAGNGNLINSNAKSTMVGGDLNFIGSSVKSSLISGDGNELSLTGGNASYFFITGSGNTVNQDEDLNNVAVFKNDFSGPYESNTAYFDGIVSASISANSISATTYYSGSTPLSTIITNIAVGLSGTSGFSGWTASTGVHSLIANNGTNTTSGKYTVIGGKSNSGTSAFSFIGGGQTNNIPSNYYHNVITGGKSNTVTGGYSTIGGGFQNSISGTFNGRVIAGGGLNSVTSFYGSILGGRSNSVTGNYSSVISGSGNTVSGVNSIISGGKTSLINSNYSFIGGGLNNSGTGIYSFVGGGKGNWASQQYSTIAGGENNHAYQYGFIGGGRSNATFNALSVVVGGDGNRTYAVRAFIGGGAANVSNINSRYSVITGGLYNKTNGIPGLPQYQFVGGGSGNTASGSCATVVAGKSNVANNDYSFVGGGFFNYANGPYSLIAGGRQNISQGDNSVTAGGQQNQSFGNNSFIGGGQLNTAKTFQSIVVGGVQNLTYGNRAIVVGGYDNINYGGHSFIGGGQRHRMTAAGAGAFIGGGSGNTVSGVYSSVIGGKSNVVNSQYSFIGAGRGNTTTVTGNQSAIVSGLYHRLEGQTSFIGAGTNNSALTTNSNMLVVAGDRNLVNNGQATVVNGTLNRSTGAIAFIGNGYKNTGSGNYSFIGNGSGNTASNLYSSVINGKSNVVNSFGGTIVSGSGNTISPVAHASAIIGCNNLTASQPSTVYMCNMLANGSVSATTFYSGSTDLSLLIGGGAGGSGGTSGNLWSASTGTNSIIANNGTGNVASGVYSMVLGAFSTASGAYSTVAGGRNVVSGYFSMATGLYNNVSARNCFITGRNNMASGSTPTNGSNSIVGGGYNTARTEYSAIMAGTNNQTDFGANASHLFIGAGVLNKIRSAPTGNIVKYSSIVSGYGNLITGRTPSSIIGAGHQNTVYGSSSSYSKNSGILSGRENIVSNGSYSSLSSGRFNKISGATHSFIGAGNSNIITGPYSSIAGGRNNFITLKASFIGAGRRNRISGITSLEYCSILGGSDNLIQGSTWSWIGGGINHIMGKPSGSVSTSFIGAGNRNYMYGANNSFIGAGYQNKIDAGSGYAMIGAGSHNSILGSQRTAIVAGKDHTTDNNSHYSVIVAGRTNKIVGDTNSPSSSKSIIGAGEGNSLSGFSSSILCGKHNILGFKANTSAILCGSGNTISNNVQSSSILAGSGITASLDETAYVPNLHIQHSRKVFLETGSTNSSAGVATLVAGTVTVTTNKVTNASIVFLTGQNSSGNAGELTISSRTAGTSFTITSANAADTRDIGWWITELV